MCLALLLAGTLRVLAAAPANDTCSAAQVIPGNGPFPWATTPVDLTEATIEPSDPKPANPFLATRVSKSVWYRFTPAGNTVYTISTCTDEGASTTVGDTVLSIFTSSGGCNGPFVVLAEGDEECGPNGAQASVSAALSADTTYYIVVWKYCDGCTDDGLNMLQLIISGSVPPPNDTCPNALPLQLNLPVTGTTVGASDTYQLSSTNAFWGLDQIASTARGRDVVYSFTAPQAGRFSIKALNYDVNQDLVLYALASCPSGPSPLSVSNALAAANRSRVNSAEQIVGLNLAAGQQVMLVVDDSNAANPGSTFTLEVTRTSWELDPNNMPAEASPLACGIEGSIYPDLDVDFYILGRYPPGWRAFALLDAEAARNSDLDLRVTSTTNTLAYDNDNNDVVFGESAPNLAGTPLPDEPTFLLVSYNGNLLKSEPYRLYAVVQPPLEQAALESEPNGSPQTASADSRNYFYGTLAGPSPSTDVDVYAFNAVEGDLIFLSLDGDPHRTNAPINARLELLDASESPVLLVNDGASSSSTNGIPGFFPTSPSEGLVYRSPVEGVFYARVSISATAAGNSGAGHYLLSISKNCLTGSGQNHPPMLSNVTMTPPVSAGVQELLTGTVLEMDTGDATTLEIRWGDGSTNTLQNPAPGKWDFSVPHQYSTPNTNHTIIVTVRDRAGNTVSVSQTVQVRAQPARFLSITRLGPSRVGLQLLGSPQTLYRVEKSDTLATWSQLSTLSAGADGKFSVEDASASTPTRFYRAVAID